MPGQKKAASGASKTAATKKKAATAAATKAAPAEPVAEQQVQQQQPPKTTKTAAKTTKQSTTSKPEEKKAATAPAAAKVTSSKDVDPTSNVVDMMATAVSTKPVAESKKAPTSTPAPIAVPEMTTVVAEPDFQRDTFDEKLLGDLNGGALDNGLDNNDFSNLNENGNNPQKISELPRKQKKMIREKRFGSDAYSGLDTNQLVATMEAEKLKRQERAQKFGLGDTEEVQADKRKERMARFKAEQQGGASGEGGVDQAANAQEEKEKMAARIARFGGNPEQDGNGGEQQEKKGPLQFTLDEYKPKQKVGNFLKKRHHGAKPHHQNNNGGGHPGGGHGGHFNKKRFMKGPHQGPPQQGSSHKFKSHPFKRAKHF